MKTQILNEFLENKNAEFGFIWHTNGNELFPSYCTLHYFVNGEETTKNGTNQDWEEFKKLFCGENCGTKTITHNGYNLQIVFNAGYYIKKLN